MKKIITQIFFLFYLSNALSQLSGGFDYKINLSDFPYTISNYSMKHGLVQNQVDAMCQFPNDDKLLLSNFDNVFTFDGYQFSNYLPTSQMDLKVFTTLYQENDKVYGNRYKELFLVFPKVKFISYCTAFTVQNGIVHYVDLKGRIIAGNKVKAKIEDPNYIKSIYAFSNKYLIAQSNTLFLLDCVSNKRDFLLNEEVRAFKKKSEEEVYVLTNNHVWIFNTYRKTLSKLFDTNKKGSNFYDIAQVEDKVIITSNSGLFIYDINTNLVRDYSEILPTKLLRDILYDKNSESIFIGTTSSGLLKLQLKTSYSIYNEKKYMSYPFFSILGIDKIVYSTSGNNLILFNNDKVKHIIPFTDNISSISKIDHLIYAGIANEIFLLNIKGEIKERYLMKANGFRGVFKDHKGVYWIAYEKGILKGNTVKKAEKFAQDRINMNVVSLYENSKQELYVGGHDGFRIISSDRKNIQIYSKKSHQIKGEIRSFLEDNQGGMWIGSNGGGIYYLKNKKIIALSDKKNCLIGNEAFTLALDKYNNVIITTNRGIRVLELQKMQDFVNNKLDYLIPYIFDENKGIYNIEFNGAFLNNYATSDKINFYFPSAQGIVKYHSRKMIYQPTKVNIYRVLSDGKPVAKNNLVFDRNVKEISFLFGSANFAEFKNLNYQYKIIKNGESTDWSLLQKEKIVKLLQIEPGNYSFLVRSVNASNVLSPHIEKLNFQVMPRFYETKWFVFLIIIIVCGTGIAIIYYRINLQKRELIANNKIEMHVKETEIRAIHSQMNPHFIFNTLQTINYLINSKEYKKAEEMLLDFSKLLRNVLEESDKIFLPLSQELQFIKLYLEIQKKRYSNNLKYVIKCEKRLHTISIPAMIIQPIVENALVHGIFHKMDGEGLIEIEVKESITILSITIKDNGIGREAAAKINRNRSHNSKAFGLIDKKIELLKLKYNINLSYSFIDIKRDGKTGTEVIINIFDYDKLSNC